MTIEAVETPTQGTEGRETKELDRITFTFQDGEEKVVTPANGDTIVYVAFTKEEDGSDTEALFGVVGENPLEVTMAGAIIIGATNWPQQTLSIVSQLLTAQKGSAPTSEESTEEES